MLNFDIPLTVAVALACLTIFAAGHRIVLLVRHRTLTAAKES